MKSKDTQGRKHMLTINNPHKFGMTHEKIKELLKQLNVTYWCMADEVSETGTLHIHLYIETASSVRYSTLKRIFSMAHIERVQGSAAQNRDYIAKAGKWADDRKAETSVAGTFEEWGEIGGDKTAKTDGINQLILLIVEGKSNAEIIETMPQYAMRLRAIDDVRAAISEQEHASKMRTITVIYISGATGTGKTSGIYAKHGLQNVFRITNYRNGKGVYFDCYDNQDVIVFEEFSSQIAIEDMLNYLDRYPIKLPARYNDKQAAYTVVYITSNLPIVSQYQYEQYHRPETWKAFLRRIDQIVEYRKGDGGVDIIDRGCGLDIL